MVQQYHDPPIEMLSDSVIYLWGKTRKRSLTPIENSNRQNTGGSNRFSRVSKMIPAALCFLMPRDIKWDTPLVFQADQLLS